MPTSKNRSGKIRARVRVDGKYLSKAFDNPAKAQLCAISSENGLEHQAKTINDRWSFKSESDCLACLAIDTSRRWLPYPQS